MRMNNIILFAVVALFFLAIGGFLPGSLTYQGCGGTYCFETDYTATIPSDWNGDIKLTYACTNTVQSGHPVVIGLYEWSDKFVADNYMVWDTIYGDAAAEYPGQGDITISNGYKYISDSNKIRVMMRETRAGSADPAYARTCKLVNPPELVSSGSVCGNGFCDTDESYQSCPADCEQPASCGDGICQTSESSESCPADCGNGGTDPNGEPDPNIIDLITTAFQYVIQSIINFLRGLLGI